MGPFNREGTFKRESNFILIVHKANMLLANIIITVNKYYSVHPLRCLGSLEILIFLKLNFDVRIFT